MPEDTSRKFTSGDIRVAFVPEGAVGTRSVGRDSSCGYFNLNFSDFRSSNNLSALTIVVVEGSTVAEVPIGVVGGWCLSYLVLGCTSIGGGKGDIGVVDEW